MKTLRWLPVALVATAEPLILGQGCPGTRQPSLTQADLTAEERGAIHSAIEAAGGLAHATGIAQFPASNNPSGQVAPGEVTVGTCPAVTTNLDPNAEEGSAIAVTIDFGATACTPAAFPGLSCSGNATGFFNPGSRSVVVEFNSIHCDSDTLSGQVQATYSFSQAGVNLDGTFDLTWVSGGDSVAVNGEGQFGYDNIARASKIPRFDGTVSNPTAEYTIGFSDVLVSYQNNGSLIPSAGLITVSGPNIRSLTIRFNTDSPSTDDVEVSIGNSPFFPVNLFTL